MRDFFAAVGIVISGLLFVMYLTGSLTFNKTVVGEGWECVSTAMIDGKPDCIVLERKIK